MKKIALFAPLVLALAAPLSAQTAVTVVQAGRLLDSWRQK
jgi:hypothetical protein